MRLRRYLLLGAAVLVALAVLATAAVRSARDVARERAQGLTRTLLEQLESFKEHARYLAKRPVEDIERHLRNFEGLARVRIYTDDGGIRIERHDYVIATVREAGFITRPGRFFPDEPEVSDFEEDADRLDVHPSLRTVLHYRVARKDGAGMFLTVYAEPFLKPLREAGAERIDSDGTVHVATSYGDGLLFIGLGILILALGAALVWVSERQLRAQERAALERELAHSERLRSLGLLTAGIAHEINNPLEGIGNWLALGDTEKAREGFDRIRRIASDLLNFARARPDEDTADLKACVQNACGLAGLGKMALDDRVPAGIEVRGAPHAIEQVFLNVLLNARQAGAGRVKIDVERGGGRVRIHFEDDGPGIAEKDLPHLFDPFFTRSGGTGLGLSLSYGLVRAMGGTMLAERGRGGGARLTRELRAK